MAVDVTRLNQDLSGQFQSDGHLFAGNAFNTGGGPINIISNSSSAQYLRYLLRTDPRIERIRILNSKDDLLDGSCAWVLRDRAFTDWWDRDDIRILWIHGDPGKGKTMMAMASVEEISRRLRTPDAQKGVLTYFFCQGTINGLNDAISMLRGLIYLLVDERRDLLDHVARFYHNEGSRLFESSYGLYALWKLLLDIVQDPLLPRLYLMIDALDECDSYQDEFLRLLTRGNGTSYSKMKWLITSRNERQIQERLDGNDLVLHTSLESHSRHVSDAVKDFIDFKMLKIQRLKKYDDKLRRTIEAYLHVNANGTFLWVALVCQRLEKTPVRTTLSVLKEFPSGLEPFYERMLGQIWHMEDRDTVDYCQRILCAATLAYRPLHLSEFVFTAELPDEFSDHLVDIHELVALCGSFLTVRDNVVYLVHQSAKDYLCRAEGSQIFPYGPLYEHKRLARRSAALMSSTLRTDVCGLEHPGTLRGEVDMSQVNSCIAAHVQYACCYWVDHLLGKPSSSSTRIDLAPPDREVVDRFFCQDLLHWLEALGLMGKISEGILAVMDLESCLMATQDAQLSSIVHDARRFMLSHRFVLEVAPLQIYSSALVFSPAKCVVRQRYARQLPGWVEVLGSAEEEWSACLQVLEGHSDLVNTAAFSPNGQLVASGSDDGTVRLWDTRTGAACGTLKGHLDLVSMVAFSPDGRLVVSGSHDSTVRLWDTRTSAACGMLEGHSGPVSTVVFSPDGQLVASGSYDNTVRLWDTRTGAACGTLEGHLSWVSTVIFSPNGRLVASGSSDSTVRLWDARTGAVCGMLEGHSSCVRTVVFSPDGQLIASGSDDSTVQLWDIRTSAACGTLEGHSGQVSTVVFSPDGQLVASGSYDRTVRLWDARTGVACGTLEGHSSWVSTVVFSPDGQLVASGSYDSTVRLWDMRTSAAHGMLEDHSGPVSTVVFSPDGQLVASGSYDSTVRLWDTRTSAAHGMPEGHSGPVNTVVFSPDGRLVASGSHDSSVRLWDARTGIACGMLEGHSMPVSTVAFSPDGQLVASGSYDSIVRLWDTRTGAVCNTLEGHSSPVRTVVFSPDGQLVASGSSDRTVRLWDARTGAVCGTLKGHLGLVSTVVFSPDGQLVASGSYDSTVRLWGARTGAIRGTLKGHSSWVSKVVFSPDGQLVASGSYDSTVRLWDARTGAACGTLEGCPGWVRTVVFSPDGQLVASRSNDNKVRLWDVKTGNTTQVIEGQPLDELLLIFNSSGLSVDPKKVTGVPSSDALSPQQLCTNSYSLDATGQWVLLTARRVLWIPPGRRPGVFVVRDSGIVIGSNSGRMTFLSFKAGDGRMV